MRFVRGLTPTSWFRLDRHIEAPPTPAPTGDPPAPVDPPTDPAKTFTQAELDKIVSDRLKREKDKYADYDAVKAKAKQLDDLEAANKTELERAQAERDTLKAERDAAKAEARATRVQSAVISAASEAGAINPADVMAVLAADAVTVKDDGTIEGVKEAVAAVLATRPHWKASNKPTGDVDQGGRGGATTDFSKASKADLASEMAKYGLRPQS